MFIIKHKTSNQYLYEIWPAGNVTFTKYPELAREFSVPEVASVFCKVLTKSLGEPFVWHSCSLDSSLGE